MTQTVGVTHGAMGEELCSFGKTKKQTALIGLGSESHFKNIQQMN